MKVLLINKSDKTGGAAVACYRLLQALAGEHVDVRMLVQEKKTDDALVLTQTHSWAKRKYDYALLAYEKALFWPLEADASVRFAFSTAVSGESIVRSIKDFDPDIIHIHWISQGFISLKGLQEIMALGKKIVWTLHDFWAFTGGCHYPADCKAYTQQCGNCLFLKQPSEKDISAEIWAKKQTFYPANNIYRDCR